MIVPLIIFITIIISYYAVLTSSMENYLTPRSLISAMSEKEKDEDHSHFCASAVYTFKVETGIASVRRRRNPGHHNLYSDLSGPS